MPSTAPIPYTAVEFTPANAASAQAMTNMSYALARLDQISNGAFVAAQKPDGPQTPTGGNNQTVAQASSTLLSFENTLSDPTSMRAAGDLTKFVIPSNGLWTLSAYYATVDRTNDGETGKANSKEMGGWFRVNGVSGSGDWGANRTSSNNANLGLWCTLNITMPLNVGDYVQVYANNYDPSSGGWAAYVYRAVVTLSLAHPL